MLITVDRFVSDADTTISRVLVDGRFYCFGLEDEYRQNKLAGETRIPSGMYNIAVRKVGGFHSRYLIRFEDFHLGMLEVLNVPNFNFILIHIGNTDQDTDGCLLVGEQAITTVGDMRVNYSTAAYQRLYTSVISSALAGELKIEYLDND